MMTIQRAGLETIPNCPLGIRQRTSLGYSLLGAGYDRRSGIIDTNQQSRNITDYTSKTSRRQEAS